MKEHSQKIQLSQENTQQAEEEHLDLVGETN